MYTYLNNTPARHGGMNCNGGCGRNQKPSRSERLQTWVELRFADRHSKTLPISDSTTPECYTLLEHLLYTFTSRKYEGSMFQDVVQERKAVSECKVTFNVRSECSVPRGFGPGSQIMGSCRLLGNANSDGRVLTILQILRANKLSSRHDDGIPFPSLRN